MARAAAAVSEAVVPILAVRPNASSAGVAAAVVMAAPCPSCAVFGSSLESEGPEVAGEIMAAKNASCAPSRPGAVTAISITKTVSAIAT